MTYALVDASRTTIIKVGPRPDWMLDSGEPAPDDVLAAGGYEVDENGEMVVDLEGNPILATDRDGWLPVVRADADYDPMLATIAWHEQADWQIEQDRVVQGFTLTNKPLLDVKSEVLPVIDAMADNYRSGFVTAGGPGQALEYDQTRREAEAWNAATSPDITDYPMLRAEYNARKIAEPEITPQGVVDDTLAEIGLWHQVGSAIKEIRRTAKVAIDVAENAARVQQIHDWAVEAFQSAALTGEFEALPAE